MWSGVELSPQELRGNPLRHPHGPAPPFASPTVRRSTELGSGADRLRGVPAQVLDAPRHVPNHPQQGVHGFGLDVAA